MLVEYLKSFRIWLGRHLAWLVRARGGNVGLIFSLCLVPLLAVTGGAIDFSMAESNKSAIQDASDSAALAGARAASNYMATNGTGPASTAQAIQTGSTAAQAVFTANYRAVGNQLAPTVTTSTTVQSGAPTTVMTVSAQYRPFLLGLIGISSVPISVTSTTTMSPANAYYQIIFVVDVSGSMSIGADPATISSLQSTAAFQCAFACHDPNNYEGFWATNWCDTNLNDQHCMTSGGGYCPLGVNCQWVQSKTMTDKRALAKRWGYKLKIDYVNYAIQNFMSQISVYNNTYPGRYSVGINTFGQGFNILLQPTSNMTAATTAAGNLDVEAVSPGWANWGYSRTTLGLTSTLNNLQNVGDGSAPNKMRTFVVFLTDAAEDVEGGSAWGRIADLNYSSACTNLKNAGVSMFSIWAPYYAVPGDDQYNTLIAPLTPQMPSVMQSCASNPNQYFRADDGASITAAVNTTFNTILNNTGLRITK